MRKKMDIIIRSIVVVLMLLVPTLACALSLDLSSWKILVLGLLVIGIAAYIINTTNEST